MLATNPRRSLQERANRRRARIDPARPAGVRRDPQPVADRFSQGSSGRGARTLDGLGMLVYQGAIAFKLWTGVEPDIAVMRRALEQVFGG